MRNVRSRQHVLSVHLKVYHDAIDTHPVLLSLCPRRSDSRSHFLFSRSTSSLAFMPLLSVSLLHLDARTLGFSSRVSPDDFFPSVRDLCVLLDADRLAGLRDDFPFLSAASDVEDFFVAEPASFSTIGLTFGVFCSQNIRNNVRIDHGVNLSIKN